MLINIDDEITSIEARVIDEGNACSSFRPFIITLAKSVPTLFKCVHKIKIGKTTLEMESLPDNLAYIYKV